MGMRPVLCAICFQPIDVKIYKIDEQGHAVHEECHATLLLHQPNKPARAGLLKRVIAKIIRR